jgi:endonuclease/exonuclease/phosphatase family metal-dependent hydrolase
LDATVLSVMCFNIWGLQFGRLSLAESLDARLRAMVGPIRGLDPDIIAFQEVWSDATWDYLVEQLDYPFVAYRPSRGRLRGRLGNGLLVLSRYPLARERVRRFSAFTHVQEFFASKGALFVDVLTAQGPVTLINTHLGSGFSPMVTPRRLAQLRELCEWIRGLPRECPVILAGDLNLSPESDSYRMFLEWIETCYDGASGDTFQQANPGEPGYTYYRSRSRYRSMLRLAHVAQRIDYIFVLCSTETAVRVAVLESAVVLDVPESPLSDHCGVLTRMEITPVSGGGVGPAEGRDFTGR